MEEFAPAMNQLLDGYRLIHFLGRGGFGEVWLCRSEAMGDYRAIKFISTANPDLLEKEYESLLHYRRAAAMLRSPYLVPIEHINRNSGGLYYVMPLADGLTGLDPSDPAWQPLSLSAKIHAQAAMPQWFSSQEVITLLLPVLQALQTLTGAGLVHRDAKPENILFFNGQPCLGDISLLGADASVITRRGTPGYGTPSWYVGGHPDMYGIAATLYTLLTGNAPDMMGRAAFIWPPQGKSSFSELERAEWRRLHAIIRRATDEKVSERYVDFAAMAGSLSMAADINFDQAAKSRFPRILVSALTVLGIAAATVVAGLRSKQPEIKAPTSNQPVKNALPELSADQKADYQALAGMIQGYIGEGNYANALASVETLLSTYPQSRSQPAYSIARAMALKGLGREDEAKEELSKKLHLSPNITAMAARKDLWEALGDLDAAEKDLTRVLDNFGPGTFPLFLRADVRAQRGDFSGTCADKKAAYAANPEELEQRKLVDAMWAPLATKYPGYGNYLKTLLPDPYDQPTDGPLTTAQIAHDDAWVLDEFDCIMSDLVIPGTAVQQSAIRARVAYSNESKEGFKNGDYSRSLKLLDQVLYSIPTLANTPVLSLYRGLLLKRLGRGEESGGELVKLCHRSNDTRLIEARVCLLSALDRRHEAEGLLSRMIAAIPASEDPSGKRSVPLLKLRARIRAILGDFPGVRNDQTAALALISDEAPDHKSSKKTADRAQIEQDRQAIAAAWDALKSRYPAYAAYLKSNREK